MPCRLLAPSLAKFGPLGVQDFEVFDLPFIFSGYEALHKVTKGDVGKQLFSKLEAKGITGLAYWDNGFKVMSANSPVKSPDDFLGLKMRIQSSKVLEAEMNALGAVPQVMAFFGSLPGTADRRGRRHGKPAVEHVHTENA